MFKARSCDCLPGAPPVRDRFWSNILNPFVSVRKVQIVTDGMIMGILILKRICLEVAPSICAASIRSGETLFSPAT